MSEDDLVRLRHMLDAAREAVSFAVNKSRSALDGDRMLALSLVKDIEIIGEAASKVSDEYKAKSVFRSKRHPVSELFRHPIGA